MFLTLPQETLHTHTYGGGSIKISEKGSKEEKKKRKEGKKEGRKEKRKEGSPRKANSSSTTLSGGFAGWFHLGN